VTISQFTKTQSLSGEKFFKDVSYIISIIIEVVCVEPFST
jgi:hypothetical protein